MKVKSQRINEVKLWKILCGRRTVIGNGRWSPKSLRFVFASNMYHCWASRWVTFVCFTKQKTYILQPLFFSQRLLVTLFTLLCCQLLHVDTFPTEVQYDHHSLKIKYHSLVLLYLQAPHSPFLTSITSFCALMVSSIIKSINSFLFDI